MQIRRIGSLAVSLLGLGCNNFGMRIDAAQTDAVVGAAIDAGVTYFDTANAYGGGGKSEELLGGAIAGRRDQVVVATKFGHPAMLGEGETPGRPDLIEAACDANVKYEFADGESLQAAAMKANEADGVTNMTWPDEVLDELRAKWEEVLADEMAANPDVKAFMESYQAFHEEYKVWGERGYLK